MSRILKLSKVSEADAIVIYPYGSRVYGTNNHKSDYDYIVVHKGDKANDAQQYDTQDGSMSVHVYHEDSWKEHLLNQKIFALECQFVGPDSPFKYEVDLALLRKEISSKASNSWVKCKKKLTVETGEEYIGIKSIFHSFRIPMFGIQIARDGHISDYSVANDMWFNEFEPMLHSIPSWEDIKNEYQPRHNALMTEFRKLAEKA